MKDLGTPTVYVVVSNDDDRAKVREALLALQFQVQEFETAEEFVRSAGHATAGCVVSSLRLPGASGLELHAQLVERRSAMPVILLSRKVSTQIVVRAMRSGVTSFLDLPVNEDELWLAVREAVAENARQRERQSQTADLRSRFETLSAGEEAVLTKICKGLTNKEIAAMLDVSVRTVESRKRRLLEKTRTGSFAELLMTYQRYLDLLGSHQQNSKPDFFYEHRQAS